MFHHLKTYWRLSLITLLLGSISLIGFIIWRETPTDKLTIAFLDVGQGDAIYIESPTHRQVLLDAGPPGSIGRPLATVMPWYDRSIDIAVISHPDLDHIGGMPAVFDRFQIGAYLEPGVPTDSGAYRELKQKVKDEKLTSIIARRNMMIDLGGGAVLTILFPDQDVSTWETNDGSIVARLTYGSTSVMLTGDSPQKVEQHLVELDQISKNKNVELKSFPIIKNENVLVSSTTLANTLVASLPFFLSLKSDVLKLGHHGSKTSSGEIFLKTVAPTLGIISVGADNKYNHPSKEVTDRLTALKIPWQQTESSKRKGNIILVSDGKEWLTVDY